MLLRFIHVEVRNGSLVFYQDAGYQDAEQKAHVFFGGGILGDEGSNKFQIPLPQ